MRICFVSRGGVQSYLKRGVTEKADLTLFCFEEAGVDYSEELAGKTHLFEEVADLSKRESGVVLCGAQTTAYGQRRNSVVVAQKGKILGVADMTRAERGEVGCGVPLRVFDTQIGRLGVVVDGDLYFCEVARTLCDCGADMLACVLSRPIGEAEKVLLRATAFFCGTPIFGVGKKNAMIADARAREVLYTPFSPSYASFEGEKEYHLIETRRRGFFPT